MRFLQQWLWGVSSSGIWRRVVRWVFNRRFGGTYRLHLQGRSSSLLLTLCFLYKPVFRLAAYSACHLLACCWTYFFDPEDGGDMFLRNVGWNSTGYMVSYPRRLYSSLPFCVCHCCYTGSFVVFVFVCFRSHPFPAPHRGERVKQRTAHSRNCIHCYTNCKTRPCHSSSG
jgi:hypothetical protein